MIEYKGWLVFGPDEDCYNHANRYIGEGVLFSEYKEDLTAEINIPKMRVYRILAGINTNSSHPYQTTEGVLTGWKYIAIEKDQNEIINTEKTDKPKKTSGRPHYADIPPAGSMAKFYTRSVWRAGLACEEGMSLAVMESGLATMRSVIIPWSEIKEWKLLKEA